ncbi:hypothetical protein [Desulfogranum japonicum]|uniref:hypothetical protein n=1 Tax=Desulfogranum japonicum TaxID=231447 RepID=UPI000419C198|nr:hypothetical protein [Desulfogranum japonicum]
MKTITLFISLFLCAFLANTCFANTGVFYGSGNQVIPIKNNQIRLVRERVDIKLSVDENSGRFGVPFIPWANVTAKFYLKNTTKDIVSLQMGFPFLDLQGFGDEKYVLDNLHFKVVSGGTEIKTELKEGLIEKEFDPKGLFKKVFAWQNKFDPDESKEVVVTYRMLMGVGSANSVFRDFDEQGRKFRAIDKLFPALSYNFGYITKTAYTWAGSVDEAVFQLDASAFYKELEKNNFLEGADDKFPKFTRPTFWEAIYPESATKDDGKHKWTFKGTVPEDGLSVNFIVLYIPSLPKEVGEYFSESLPKLEETKPAEFKTVLKSFYQNIAFGKQPSDSFAESYFKQVRLVKMPKTFLTEKDRKNIEEIARNFDELIKE